MRSHLTYANVVSTLCLFILLGGSAYAASTITGKNVRNSSLTGKDIKNSSLGSGDIKDRALLAKDFKAGQLPRGATGAAGPQGPAGAAGATKIVTRTAVQPFPGPGIDSKIVYCEPGERAVSGGAAGSGTNPGDGVAGTTPVTRAQGFTPPTGTTPEGWSTSWNAGGNVAGRTIYYYVICVQP